MNECMFYISEEPKPLDCIASLKGTDYTGNVNTTVGGLTCQRWDSDSPTKHSYHDYDDHENYCRNIRGDENNIWCYTTDPDTRWDFCKVPRCGKGISNYSIICSNIYILYFHYNACQPFKGLHHIDTVNTISVEFQDLQWISVRPS